MLMAVKCDMLLYTDDTSSIVKEVIRAIIGLLFFFIKRFYMQKKSNKKYTSRYVLKIFKELFIYLHVFLKAFKIKKSAYKNIWTKVTYSIMSHYFCASFLRVQKYLHESYLLHLEPLFLCIFFTRIKNI